MQSKQRLKGKIKRHHAKNTTGETYLDNYEYKLRRKENFPENTLCTIEPSHFINGILIFMVANKQGDIDYFEHRELELINPFVLYDYAPYLFKSSEKFKKYLSQFNYF